MHVLTFAAVRWYSIPIQEWWKSNWGSHNCFDPNTSRHSTFKKKVYFEALIVKILKNLVLQELCWAIYLLFTFQNEKKESKLFFFKKLSGTGRFEILAKVLMVSGFLNSDPGSVNAIAYVKIWIRKYPICDGQTHDLDYIFVCKYLKICYRNLKNPFIWNENNIFWHNFAAVYKPYIHHVNHYPQA